MRLHLAMPPLRLYLYRMPSVGCQPDQWIVVNDVELLAWNVDRIEQSQFDLSFEQAAEQLAQLPRMFVEPDGSFTWTGKVFPQVGSVVNSEVQNQDCDVPWQLEGMLYDYRGRIGRVELRGQCPADQWLSLMECLQPSGNLIAYLIDAQRFVMASDLLALWKKM